MIIVDESGDGSMEGKGNERMGGENGYERIQGGNYASGSMEGNMGANQNLRI